MIFDWYRPFFKLRQSDAIHKTERMNQRLIHWELLSFCQIYNYSSDSFKRRWRLSGPRVVFDVTIGSSEIELAITTVILTRFKRGDFL